MDATSSPNKSLYSLLNNKSLRSIPSSNVLSSRWNQSSLESVDQSTLPPVALESVQPTGNMKGTNMKKITKNVGNVLRFVGRTISENKEVTMPGSSASKRSHYFDPVEVEKRRLDELRSSLQADTDRLLQEISPDSEIQSELRRVLQGKDINHVTAQEALKSILAGSSDTLTKRKVSIATSPFPNASSSTFSPRPSSTLLNLQPARSSSSRIQSSLRRDANSKPQHPEIDLVNSPRTVRAGDGYVQGYNLLSPLIRQKESPSTTPIKSNQKNTSPSKLPSHHFSQPAIQMPQNYGYNIPFYPQGPIGYGFPVVPQPIIPPTMMPDPYQQPYYPNPYPMARYGNYHFNNPFLMNYGFEANSSGVMFPHPQIPTPDHVYPSSTFQPTDPHLQALEAENMKLLSQLNLLNTSSAVSQVAPTVHAQQPSITTSNENNSQSVSSHDDKKFKEELKPTKKPKKLTVLEKKYQDELSSLTYQLEKLKKQEEIETLKQSIEQQKQRRMSEQRHELWLLEQQHRLEMMQVKQLMNDEDSQDDSSLMFDLASTISHDTASIGVSSIKSDAGKTEEYTIYDKEIWSAAGVGLSPYHKLSPSSNAAEDNFFVYVDGFLLDENSAIFENGSAYRIAVGLYDNDSQPISKLTASGWQSIQADDSSLTSLHLHLLPKPMRKQVALIDGHSIKSLIEVQCRLSSSNESTTSLGWIMSPVLTDTISLPAKQNILASIKTSTSHPQQRFIHTGMWRIPLRDGIADPTIDMSSLESRSSHGFILVRIVHNCNAKHANSWSAVKAFDKDLNQIARNYVEVSHDTSEGRLSSRVSSLTNSFSPTPVVTDRSSSSRLLSAKASPSPLNLVHRSSFNLGSSSKLMTSPMKPHSSSEPSTTTVSPRQSILSRNNSINKSNSLLSAMTQAKRAFSIRRLPSRRNSLTKIQEESSGADENEASNFEETVSPELRAISRMVSQSKFGSSSAMNLSSKKDMPWISGSTLSPCTAQYSPTAGDGVDVLIDACRFLPDNIYASRICVKVFYPSKQQYGSTCISYAVPTSSASSPKFQSRFQIRCSSSSEPLSSALMLIIRVDGIDSNGASGVIGYSCVRLFSTKDREEVPPHSVEPYYVNTGAFQLPIHTGSPLGVTVFDESMLQELPKTPCATVLLRISHAPSAGSAYDPVSIQPNYTEGIDDQSYGSGMYYNQPSEPSLLENMAYTAKQSLAHNTISSLIATLPDDTGLPAKPLNPSEMPSYIESLFPSVDKMPSFIDYRMACPYTNGAGVQVCIDQVLNLPIVDPSTVKQTSAFNIFSSSHAHPNAVFIYNAIFSSTPPGLFYKNFALKEHRMNGVYHTKDIDYDQSASNQTKYFESFELLQPQVTNKNAYLIVDIRAVKVEANTTPSSTRNKDIGSSFKVSMDEQKIYWTMMPLLVDHHGNHYVNSGVYQLPLIEGRVPSQGSNSTQSDELLFSADPFDELIQRIKASPATVSINPSFKLSDGASIIVRVVNPILKDVLTYHKALDPSSSTSLFAVPNAPTGSLAAASSIDGKFMNTMLEAAVEASNAKPSPGQRKASASTILTIDKLRNKFKHVNKAFPQASGKDSTNKNTKTASDYLRKIGNVEEILAEVHRVFTNETGLPP
jgi:hypothetical protein